MFNEPIVNKGNIVLCLEGNADDLLNVSDDGHMKSVTLLYLGETDLSKCMDCQPPSVDITMTSVDLTSINHELIDSIKGKKIRFTAEIID